MGLKKTFGIRKVERIIRTIKKDPKLEEAKKRLIHIKEIENQNQFLKSIKKSPIGLEYIPESKKFNKYTPAQLERIALMERENAAILKEWHSSKNYNGMRFTGDFNEAIRKCKLSDIIFDNDRRILYLKSTKLIVSFEKILFSYCHKGSLAGGLDAISLIRKQIKRAGVLSEKKLVEQKLRELDIFAREYSEN